MTQAEKLILLRHDLQDPPGVQEAYLLHLLAVAAAKIREEGITLTDSMDDGDLEVMYASWRYRCRNKDDSAMPRMLRFALNNRLMAEKGRTDDAV